MYCSHCGKEVNEGALFCQNCGINLNETPIKKEEVLLDVNSESASKKLIKNKVWRNISIIIAIIGLVAVGAYNSAVSVVTRNSSLLEYVQSECEKQNIPIVNSDTMPEKDMAGFFYYEYIQLENQKLINPDSLKIQIRKDNRNNAYTLAHEFGHYYGIVFFNDSSEAFANLFACRLIGQKITSEKYMSLRFLVFVNQYDIYSDEQFDAIVTNAKQNNTNNLYAATESKEADNVSSNDNDIQVSKINSNSSDYEVFSNEFYSIKYPKKYFSTFNSDGNGPNDIELYASQDGSTRVSVVYYPSDYVSDIVTEYSQQGYEVIDIHIDGAASAVELFGDNHLIYLGFDDKYSFAVGLHYAGDFSDPIFEQFNGLQMNLNY